MWRCGQRRAHWLRGAPHAAQVIAFFTTARLTQFYSELFLAMGAPVLEMHSRKSQPARTRAANAFRSGSQVLCCLQSQGARISEQTLQGWQRHRQRKTVPQQTTLWPDQDRLCASWSWTAVLQVRSNTCAGFGSHRAAVHAGEP